MTVPVRAHTAACEERPAERNVAGCELQDGATEQHHCASSAPNNLTVVDRYDATGADPSRIGS